MNPIRFADIIAALWRNGTNGGFPPASIEWLANKLRARRPRHATYRLRRLDGSERVVRVRTLGMMEFGRGRTTQGGAK